MKYWLQLLTLICCRSIQGDLEWTVIGKVTDYGQNVTLFCNVTNCCPKNAGWDRYSPEQRTLFIDLKTAQPNKKYDGKVLSNGYTLIIQNLTKQDLNVSYSCLYGVTFGEIKILLEDDVFIYEIQPSIPNDNSRLSGGQIAGIVFGVVVPVVVAALFIVKILWRYRKRRKKGHIKRHHNGADDEEPFTGDNELEPCTGEEEVEPLLDRRRTDEEKSLIDWMSLEERDTYKAAIQDGEEERQHVRIQVIGKHGVGKTSLVRTLLGKPFKENLESTDGIDIVRECQIRKTDCQWIIGEDKTKSARIRRIIQAVKLHQNHEKEKELASACSDQPHAIDGYSSETDRKEPEQEPTQSIEKTFETESVDGISDNKDNSIYTDNIGSVSKSDSDKHEAYSIDTEQSMETPADLNDTEQSMEPHSDLNDTEQSMETIAYSVESPVIVNSKMIDQTTKEIMETMTGNMNEIIKKAKREKENMISENLVECDFWDFAGQKEYYATHQTFCSQNSIYLIVADINDDIKDTQPDEHFNHIGDYIGFWLDSIHFLCTDLREGKLLCPPVIMVFTGIDKATVEKITESNEEYRRKFLTNFGWQPKADHIRCIRFISNKNPCKEEIDRLKTDITDIAKELEYFVEKRPTRWINLEYALEVMKGLENTVPVLSFEDIHKLAEKNSIHGKELLLFLNYQHKIGNIVFFDDIREYIILQPNWLVSCFKCLICDDDKRDMSVMTEMYNLKHGAQLSDTLIDGLFQKVPDLKFRDHKGHILKVMEKFDIIVKPQFKNTINTNHNSYYMPCMIGSSDITLTNIMNQLDVCDYNRSPWLVFEFMFFPIAYYNHIFVSYIRKYKVCTVGDNSPAIYEGKAVLYLDDTEERLLIICFSRNAISLQIWKWREVDDLIYQQIIDELCDEVIELENRYSVNISYEIKAKCNTGDYFTNDNRKTYDYINKQCAGGTYHCKEHADYHSKKEIENTWFKHVQNVIMENWNKKLVTAARKGDKEDVKICLENKADINYQGGSGGTALMWAAEGGRLEICRLLIDRGCKIDITMGRGWTALMIAVMEGRLEICRLLIDRGCEIDITDGRGWTALMYAAEGGHLEICRLLIDRGCKIDITNRDGYTALHLAAQEGYLQTTRCLVEQGGASPSVTTHQGKTPYDLAAAKLKFDPRYKELVEYLQKIRDISESILTKLIQLNRDDFQDLVALGTFSSYENRVFLAGPCNIGTSSLASILIDEAIPKTWYSTDGLVIHFGRNGIDLQHRKMIPLKKGSGDILTKLLLGNPELKEQQIRPVESQIEQNVDKNIDKVPGDPKSNLTTNESKLNPYNMDNLPPKQQRQKNKSAPEMTSSERQQQIPIQTSQKTLKGIQEQPSHTAHSIQDDLMEKIKEGTYIMKIAPSDLVDFGGQRSFDMTHQLFIQHRGTFILMFDGRLGLDTELEEYPQGDVTAASILEHWINSILTYCTKSDDKMPRIVFAATHSDSFSEDEKNKLVVIFQEELTKMFSSHKLHEHILYDKVFFINATDKADEEIGCLKDKLVDIAFQQSTWGQQMPIVWVPLDLQISDMRTDGVKLITKEKLLEMNKNNKEFALSEQRVEDFLLVQHSIGKLLYFNEPALRDFVVIQPSAMVNILRAFITDRMFWPENGPIRDILENLSSTGVLTKTDLFTLWLQPAFKDILMNDRKQDYVVQVLLHLDILVEPKHYAGKDFAADSYLVPCIVASKFPPTMQNAATDDRTICIAYHLKETVVPSALSFKLIGAAISIWPLKLVDARYCLYYQAAVMDTDTRNELQIHVKGQRIVAYLVNDMSKHLISPDLATTIQECLTLALGRILKFYGHCFGRENHHVTSDLFEIEVGEVCKGETCLIPLSDAKTKAHWRCKNGKIHKTKFPLNWVVDKNKKQCDSNCKGLETEAQLLTPDDQHFVQLARTIGIGDFYNFFIELGMEKADYDNLNFRYFSNPMDFMLMGLFEWRDKTESDQLTATFGKLQKALTAIERQHYLCQIHREDHTLVEKAHSRLQDVPSDDVIDALTDKNLIGDCVVHLGVELCLSIGDIKKTLYNFPRDLNGQVHDLLTKWKNCNEIKMVKPTIYRLMVALQHIKAAKGLSFVKKTYGVE